jgi:hypothetical protein
MLISAELYDGSGSAYSMPHNTTDDFRVYDLSGRYVQTVGYLSTKSHGITFHKRTRASANNRRKLPTAMTHGNGISGQSVTKGRHT